MKLVNCLSLKAGTKVRIRKWEDLNKEFIHCGRVVTIKTFKRSSTYEHGLVNVFFLEEAENNCNNPLFKWTWTNQMIELFDPKSKDCLNKI